MAKTKPALGHRFGPDLICPCGMSWELFQMAQSPCPRSDTGSTQSPDEPGDVETEKDGT